MRAAVYVRVSSKRQAEEGLSLDEQERRCREFIDRQGWQLDERHFYREEGISGAKKSRPALDRLVRAVEAAEVDVLVSPAIDRIGRSMVHTEALFETFDAAGVDLWNPAGQHYSGDDASAKFTRRVLSAAAELERDMISERVAAVTEAKAERGSYHGGIAPYGYRIAEDKDGNRIGGLVVYEPEAKWVRHMFRRYVDDGATFYKIAQELDDESAPTNRGGKWVASRVADRIAQPIYAGLVKFGETGKHEPLVDQRTFRLAQERREATKALNGSGRGRQPSIHLLSHGLFKCACGASMAPRRDSRSNRRTYRCVTRVQRARKGATPCTIPALPQELVDEAVLRYLAHEVISPGLTTRELEAEQERAVKDARQARSEAERAAREATSRLEAAELKWLDGKMDDARYDALRKRFEQERAEATQEATRATATIDALTDPDPDTLEAVERLRGDLDAAANDPDSLTRYRQLIVKLFDSFELIQVPADAPEVIEDVPRVPTFVYKQKALRKGQPEDEREHRYYLLPELRPELAELYGTEPLVGAPPELVRRIERKGSPIRAIGLLALARLSPRGASA